MNMSRKLTLLAIDAAAFQLHNGACLYLNQPVVRPEPVLRPSPPDSGAPDDAGAHFYGTVLQDQGKFRMWYYACHQGRNPDWQPRQMQQTVKAKSSVFQGPLCYAESADGIVWNKPALGQVLFKGSRENNALALPHTIVSGALVIRDDADADPARRYKMAYQFFPENSAPEIPEYGWQPSVALAVSADGIRWTVTGIPFLNQFVEPSSFFRHAGQYLIHYQVMDTWCQYFAEGGTPCGRTGVARVSRDWDHWPDLIAESFTLPEPEDPAQRGMDGAYDQVHLGVGAVSLGNVCVGLYGLWHNADNKTAFDSISGDFGLLVSNDGIRFREPVKGYRFIRREDSPATPVAGHDFNTILCQANGILNVGDETRIYHGRWRNAQKQDNQGRPYSSGEVALATLPRDRWGAFGLNPKAQKGVVCTSPLSVPAGGVLALNADGPDGIGVDLLDENFQPVAGFEGGTLGGPDRLRLDVRWQGRNLDELNGRSVRVRVRMQRLGETSPRLYAIYAGQGI